MLFNVLKNWHYMYGIDWHDLMPPGSPTITGKAPYVATALLVWVTGPLTAKFGPRTSSHWGWTMKRGTDIGPLIPHIGAPNILLPLIYAFSGSKSYFGTTRVLAEGDPVAIAIGETFNLNLNCDGPTKMPPLPTGFVLAFTTHTTSITVGDFVADLAQMIFDSALQFGLAQLFNLPFFQVPAAKFYEEFLFGPMISKVIPVLGLKGDAIEFLAKGIAIQLPLHIAGLLLGTPVGWSPPFAPIGSGGYGAEDKAHDALRDYINGTGNQHPSSPPPSPPPPPADAGAPPPPPPADAGAPPPPPPADAGTPPPPPPADAGAPPPPPPADAGAPRPGDAGVPKPKDAGAG